MIFFYIALFKGLKSILNATTSISEYSNLELNETYPRCIVVLRFWIVLYHQYEIPKESSIHTSFIGFLTWRSNHMKSSLLVILPHLILVFFYHSWIKRSFLYFYVFIIIYFTLVFLPKLYGFFSSPVLSILCFKGAKSGVIKYIVILIYLPYSSPIVSYIHHLSLIGQDHLTHIQRPSSLPPPFSLCRNPPTLDRDLLCVSLPSLPSLPCVLHSSLLIDQSWSSHSDPTPFVAPTSLLSTATSTPTRIVISSVSLFHR